MNDAQQTKYWVNWNQCRRKLREMGYDAKGCEQLRKRIHIKAGAYFFKGRGMVVKSSKRLNNTEFDGCLKHFLSISAGGDLVVQLELLDQPAKRMLYACCELLDELGIDPEQERRQRYLEGIVKKPLPDTDESDLQKAIIACTRNVNHRRRKRAREGAAAR